MITIGITGGIAAGKSAVSRLLAERGARIVDADRVAQETYAPGTPGFEAVVAAFGREVVGRDRAIDRRALGRLVFSAPARLKQLTDIVWPLTRARLEALKAEHASAGALVLVLEAAVLREAGWAGLVDEVWLIRAPEAIALARLLSRPGLSATEAAQRIAAQKTSSAGLEDVDVVIDNDGDLDQLERRADAAWQAALARRR